MDFVTELLTDQGFNTILVITYRLSKERHFIACTTDKGGTSTESTAELFIQNIVCLYRLPDTVISDQGPQFIS
jgi:hypothetical protein